MDNQQLAAIQRRIKREKNLRFKIAFTETNIRHHLFSPLVDEKKVAWLRSEVKKAEAELATLPPVFG